MFWGNPNYHIRVDFADFTLKITQLHLPATKRYTMKSALNEAFQLQILSRTTTIMILFNTSMIPPMVTIYPCLETIGETIWGISHNQSVHRCWCLRWHPHQLWQETNINLDIITPVSQERGHFDGMCEVQDRFPNGWCMTSNCYTPFTTLHCLHCHPL